MKLQPCGTTHYGWIVTSKFNFNKDYYYTLLLLTVKSLGRKLSSFSNLKAIMTLHFGALQYC